MPIVKRSIVDMIGHFAPFTDVLVNPVNCGGEERKGVMGAGVAKAFADTYPAMYEDYKRVCSKGELTIGTLHIYTDPESKIIIINFPTKRDWRDRSRVEDIEMGCIKLAEYLTQHPFYTVAMPALGTGLGKIDPVVAEDVFMQHLDPLPNIIHLSMRPDRFEHPPLYLGVVGSRAYTDYERIDLGVSDGLIEFALDYKDFSGLVSGGAGGVDSVACGSGRPGYNQPTLAKQHGIKPIVCQADWQRYSNNSAGFIRNRTVMDIATHVVAFVGKQSTGTRNLVELVVKYNRKVDAYLQEMTIPSGWDVFRSPAKPIPVKKQLHICDISSVCR